MSTRVGTALTFAKLVLELVDPATLLVGERRPEYPCGLKPLRAPFETTEREGVLCPEEPPTLEVCVLTPFEVKAEVGAPRVEPALDIPVQVVPVPVPVLRVLNGFTGTPPEASSMVEVWPETVESSLFVSVSAVSLSGFVLTSVSRNWLVTKDTSLSLLQLESSSSLSVSFCSRWEQDQQSCKLYLSVEIYEMARVQDIPLHPYGSSACSWRSSDPNAGK